MKLPLISILVAAYNVQPYIKECLDSIKNQNYENIDVIIVDDYSSDNTRKICKEYTETDSRFSLVEHKHNKGLLLARKSAVQHAKGEYSIFVDGDDYLYNNNAIDELVAFINEEESDIYRFFATVNGTTKRNKKKWESFLNRGPTHRTSSIEILEDYFLLKNHPWNLWSSCYKTSLLKNVYNKIKNVNFTCCEDGYTSFLIASNAKRYIYIKTKPIYSYRIDTGISTKEISTEVFIKRSEELRCIKWLEEYINQSIDKQSYERTLNCLKQLEETLTSAYVDRLLAIPEKNLVPILTSSIHATYSATTTLNLINRIKKQKQKQIPIHRKIKNNIKLFLNLF